MCDVTDHIVINNIFIFQSYGYYSNARLTNDKQVLRIPPWRNTWSVNELIRLLMWICEFNRGHIISWWQADSQVLVIGIDPKIEVIVVSPTTCEAHHSPRAKPEGCGELPRSLVTQKWPKSRDQFLFYHDASKHIKFLQILVCKSRESLIKLLQISHYGKHGHIPLSQQSP